MAGVVKKSEQMAERQRHILEVLASCSGGQAGFDYLTEKLHLAGYRVVERSVRADCGKLVKQELAVGVKKGAAITEKGRRFLLTADEIHEEVKIKHLKQMVILKSLYYNEAGPGNRPRGMRACDVARIEGIGSEDTAEDILNSMSAEGLVYKDREHWRLGREFPRPFTGTSQSDSRLIFEYLNTVSCLVPLPPDLASLAGKLVPAMMVTGQELWIEDLARITDRIIVHGRGPADPDPVIALAEEAITLCRTLSAKYRGRPVKLHPMGIVYHWEKSQWYIISCRPAGEEIREYRTDRLTETVLEDSIFDKPLGFDLLQYGIPGTERFSTAS